MWPVIKVPTALEGGTGRGSLQREDRCDGCFDAGLSRAILSGLLLAAGPAASFCADESGCRQVQHRRCTLPLTLADRFGRRRMLIAALLRCPHHRVRAGGVMRWSPSARPHRSRPPSTMRRTSTCPGAARPPAPRFPHGDDQIALPAIGRRNHLAGRRLRRPAAAARRAVAGPPIRRGAAGPARRPAPVPPPSPPRIPRTSKCQARRARRTTPASTGVR
jgi:hypothetical protein